MPSKNELQGHPAGLWVHRSNRMERLAEMLVEVASTRVPDPFARECIVVQGRGIERWLSMELARHLTVWGNPEFPFPRKLFERLLDLHSTDAGKIDPYDPDVLTWAICQELPPLLEKREFSVVRAYVERARVGDTPRGGTDFETVALAQRLAEMFDQYVVYRPAWILDWEQGKDDSWQAILWRSLCQRLGPDHIAARVKERLCQPDLSGGLPERISLFGLSAIPPLYLELLAHVARSTEVHLFLLSPSKEYWAWTRSRREIWRQTRHQPEAAASPQEVEGNPLVASLGKIGRNFQEIFLDTVTDYFEKDLYDDPGLANALSVLQSDILHLRYRASASDVAPLALAPDDDSIALHACHSPMREVEVLLDQLRDLFERDRTLEPRDVIVMSPDIDSYAPLIDAVFSVDSEHEPAIPYRIADRRIRATDDVIDSFLVLLEVLGGRFGASEIVDLLSHAPLREKFGFAPDELDTVREWVRSAQIRWGIDSEHRVASGQPEVSEYTWRFGLDRLLLGYAMEGREERMFGGVLPFDDMEGSETESLGKLADFCEALFRARESLSTPRRLTDWQGELTALLRHMLANTDATAHEHRQIIAELKQMVEQSSLAGFDGMLSIDTVRQHLERHLERGAPGRAFMTGGVTFCAMVPMRSVPFRVVCLLGMNDTAFPRIERPLGFDLMVQSPKAGDPSRRDDDRYLFLEALLSARQRLLITYVGRGVRDNAEMPPSVVVSELLDTIDQSFAPGQNGTPASQRLLTQHPLQPFSRRYFTGEPRLFTYAQRLSEGARKLLEPRSQPPPFFDAALPGADRRGVSIEDLIRFFENPSRVFLQRCLGIRLEGGTQILEDAEPVSLSKLDEWDIGTFLLKRRLRGEELDQSFEILRAAGRLPLGVPGVMAWEDVRDVVEALASVVREHTDGEALEPIEVSVVVGNTRLAGALTNLWPQAQVQYRFGKLKPKYEIAAWIRHLLLNLVRDAGTPDKTILLGRGGDEVSVVRYEPVQDAHSVLEDLVDLYWVGQGLPLPFFPKASWDFAERMRRKNPDVSAARRIAQNVLAGEYAQDDADAYVRFLYTGSDPLQLPEIEWDEPQFESVARVVFDPLLGHRTEVQ